MPVKLSHNLSVRTPFYDGLPRTTAEQIYDLRAVYHVRGGLTACRP